jgi:hypothetical protein
MPMRRRFLCISVAFLLAVVCTHAGDKKKQILYTKPNQSVDLEAPKLITAHQDCENWALAAGLEGLLKQQNVSLEQAYLVMRVYGGELCVPDSPPSIEAFARIMNNEFVLDDGRHVRLELRFSSGAPSNTDALIYSLKQQQLSLVLLRGHPYYLTGATFDEQIGRDGSRMFIIRELRLANTLPKQPGITFENGKDNVEDIQGIVSVNVIPGSQ